MVIESNTGKKKRARRRMMLVPPCCVQEHLVKQAKVKKSRHKLVYCDSSTAPKKNQGTKKKLIENRDVVDIKFEYFNECKDLAVSVICQAISDNDTQFLKFNTDTSRFWYQLATKE